MASSRTEDQAQDGQSGYGVENYEEQRKLLVAIHSEAKTQTALLRSIRTIGAWLLILAILGPIALWIATTVIVNAL